jgi:hypothetical protein
VAYREWRSQNEYVERRALQASGTASVAKKRVLQCGVAFWPSTPKLGEELSPFPVSLFALPLSSMQKLYIYFSIQLINEIISQNSEYRFPSIILPVGLLRLSTSDLIGKQEKTHEYCWFATVIIWKFLARYVWIILWCR